MDKVKPWDYFTGRKIEPQVGDGAALALGVGCFCYQGRER